MLMSLLDPQNSAPAPLPGATGQQAVALRLSANYTMLYRCSILGNQDTLYDRQGKHYILECDIQGTVDFICGVGQSLYQVTTIQHFILTSKFHMLCTYNKNMPTKCGLRPNKKLKTY